MPAPHDETLRDLLNLLRASDDESAREPPSPRQDVGGPYRSERQSLQAQVQDELARLEHEQALLNERRALITAVRHASRPQTFPHRFARTLAFGAMLGAATSMATLLIMIAPLLGPDSRVSLRPPSEWRVSPATPVVASLGSAATVTGPEAASHHLCSSAEHPRPGTAAPATLGRGITQITETVWDVDRQVVLEALVTGRDSLRLVSDERLGVRIYGLRRASPMGQLGLLNGDELIALDGVLARDLMARARAMSAEPLARELTDATRIELSLVRQGEPMTFTYLLR